MINFYHKFGWVDGYINLSTIVISDIVTLIDQIQKADQKNYGNVNTCSKVDNSLIYIS